ncbi:hypothetical protein FO519_009106, partial [Halicephalobus sp. NKZ332]
FMPGYKDIVRSFNTSAPLLNAVLSTAPVSSGDKSSLNSLPKRKILRESDRTRNAINHRRQDHVQQRFREVYRERRQLIERHREAIESIDLQDLSSIVEGIEFSQNVDKNVLQNVLKLVSQDPKKLSKLNDRQLGALISAGGKVADLVPVDFRIQYVSSMWKSIKENSIPADVLSYNCWISVNIDNGVEQDPVEILKELGRVEIQPDEQTFGLLAKIYSFKGQTSGILKIIDLLKEQNIPATQFLFESLVYSFSLNNEDQQVKTIIQSLSSNPAVNVSGLYLSSALATARSMKDVDKVINVLTSIPHAVGFKRRENLPGMIELGVYLIENGATGVLSKLKPFMFVDQNNFLPANYPTSTIVKKIHQLYQGGNEAGAVELFSLLNGDSRGNTRRYFEEELFKKASNPEKVAQISDLLRQNNVLSNPLTKLVDRAYAEKLPIFPFYSIFINSPEFEPLKERKHLLLPKIVKLIKDLKKVGLKDPNKHQLFQELFNTVEFNQLSGEIRKEIALLIIKEAENEEEFSKFLDIHSKFSKSITTTLVSEMMWTDKLEKLESLMNGPLTNEKVYLSRILPSIMRILKQTNITDPELRTISKVICAGFPQDGQSGSLNGSFGFRIIREIFVSNLITDQRLGSLVRLLSEDPNVSLSSEEIKKIESELRTGNKGFRADLIKQLQRKSKAVIRWLSSDIEKLEKEVEYLESTEDVKPEVKGRLYDILLKKYSEDREKNNGKEMLKLIKKFEKLDLNSENGYFHPYRFVTIALSRSLQNGDLESAEELWKIKKDHSDELKLLYSLVLLKKTPEDHVFIRALQNGITEAKTLEKFIEIIGKQFSISNLTRRRLTNVIKKMELRNAISEDRISSADLMVMLEKTVNMYRGMESLENLKKLQADIVKVKFVLDRKLKAHLDNAIVKVAASKVVEKKKQMRKDSMSSSHTQQSLSSNISSSDEKEQVGKNGIQTSEKKK